VKKQLLIISIVLLGTTCSKAQNFDTLATFTIPNHLALGVAFDYVNNYYVISSGGQSNTLNTDNIFLRYDLNFNLVDSISEPPGLSTNGFGIRDLAFDGTNIYGSYDNQVQRFDPTTLQPVNTFTGLNNPNRGMAVDTDGTVFSCDFTTGPIAHFTGTGATVATCPATSVTGNAPYGLAVDNWTMPGTKRLWMNTPSIAGSGLFLTRFDYATCTIDTNVDLTAQIPSTSTVATTTSGGLDIINNHPNYPGKIVGIVLGQNNPTAFVMLVDMGPAPVGVPELTDRNHGLINLYPNPVKDQMNFLFNTKQQGTAIISIHDYLGREVLSQVQHAVSGENKMTLDLSKKVAGVYFITVTCNESVISSKFTKE
jgi:hypothetical protein